MKKIEMSDLVSQYHRIKPEIDSAITGVLESGRFIGGYGVESLSKNLQYYLAVKHVIPCANGTDALQIAMMALDLQPEDEIITPNFTYAATVEVVALLKLTPVLVEVNPDTFCVSVDEIEKAITPRTKAIVPVHLFGQCADMEGIMALAKKYNLFVIEDTAQAIGAEYTFSDGTKKRAGTIGTIGTTSFFPSKNLGCYGDGGAIFTNDDALAQKLKMIANHGQSSQYNFELVGCNSRLDNLQAVILDVKLKELDDFCMRRQAVAVAYDTAFANLNNAKIPYREPKSTHVFHQYTLLLRNINREEIREKLAEVGVPTMVYYPKPMHVQAAYKDSRYDQIDFSLALSLSANVLSLPIHTEMDSEQISYIISKVTEIIG